LRFSALAELRGPATCPARDYDCNPYAGYERKKGLHSPVPFRVEGNHPKEWVLGLEINGRFNAHDFGALAPTYGELRKWLGRRVAIVRIDPEHGNVRVEDTRGRPVPAVASSWLVWYGFYPDTLAYKAKPEKRIPCHA
jgi:hypothetical protein